MKLSSEIQCSSSTHSRLIIAICAAGPPHASAPKRRKRKKIEAGVSSVALIVEFRRRCSFRYRERVAPPRRRLAWRTVPRSSRPAGRHIVAGVDVEKEAKRLRMLPVFTGGPLARRAPPIRVRRACRRPQRLGFAVLSEWRVSVTAYPGIRPGDVRETLLHELVHLHCGSEPGNHRWHGPVFRNTLRQAMEEAYGLVGIAPSSALHGAYAEALETIRATRAGGRGIQLELPLAA